MTMKKFLLKTGLFLAFVVVADLAFNKAMSWIAPRVKGGEYGRDNYISNEVDADLLIFGSSRAECHYNAQMIEDSLGIISYNCGQTGHSVFLNYARLLMIKERHHPKIIIYDIAAGFDLLTDNDNYKDMSFLKLHYDRDGISDIICDIAPLERYKMLSGMYKYNSNFLQLLLVWLHPVSDAGIKGFRPYKNSNDVWLTPPPKRTEWAYDSLKISYLNKIIESTRDSKLYFVVSPLWQGMNTEIMKPAKEMCAKYNISFIDFSNDPKYVENTKLFKDYAHLNATGADEFTKDLIHELKK